MIHFFGMANASGRWQWAPVWSVLSSRSRFIIFLVGVWSLSLTSCTKEELVVDDDVVTPRLVILEAPTSVSIATTANNEKDHCLSQAKRSD